MFQAEYCGAEEQIVVVDHGIEDVCGVTFSPEIDMDFFSDPFLPRNCDYTVSCRSFYYQLSSVLKNLRFENAGTRKNDSELLVLVEVFRRIKAFVVLMLKAYPRPVIVQLRKEPLVFLQGIGPVLPRFLNEKSHRS